MVRAQRRQDLERLHDRDLRRGAHRARREDERRDPRLDRPDLHRHDGHGRADRPPRDRPVPDADLALRPRAGGAPRRDLAAALRAHPARPGRAHDRQGAAAPRRGRHRVRPGDARRTARPARRSTWPSRTSTRRASTACPASSTPPACATPTTSRRRSATEGIKAQAVSGETPKRELAEILARYERGEIDVLINAQLLAEGWNSPRATVCVHLAPTASKRIYQQRVGRVTRRHPGKEAGLVVDFVHPATKHDDPVVTLHSLLDRDVYRGGAIVVGPVRRGRGRRVRVERRVLPVCAGARAPRPRSSSASCGGSRSSTSTTASSTCGPRWPAPASRPTAGAARARCSTSTATASCAGRFLITAVQRNTQLRQLRLRGADGDRRGARPRRLRHGDRHHRHLAARGAPRGRKDHAPGARRQADRPA